MRQDQQGLTKDDREVRSLTESIRRPHLKFVLLNFDLTNSDS